MTHNSCGCTREKPGPGCEEGERLYATAMQAFQHVVNGPPMAANGERRAVYLLAYYAYTDHCKGWQEGDVKVQRKQGFWIIAARFCGQWVLQFGTQDTALLEDWLSLRGYEQFVQVHNAQSTDHFLGYYRKSATSDQQSSTEGTHLLTARGAPPSLLAEREVPTPAPQASAPGVPFSSSIDLTARVAIHIALMVARCARPLTVVDRLSVQRRAARLLQDHGVHTTPRDEQMLSALIEEAIQQKALLDTPLGRSTQALE